MYFKDRNQAGGILAEKLVDEWKDRNAVVLAIPRGGVPVAYPIARRLAIPLDILLVRKLGVPGNPEYGFGAIAEDGQFWLNQDALNAIQLSQAEIDRVASSSVREMFRQDKVYREARLTIEVKNRSVLLVDDGLATGSTM